MASSSLSVSQAAARSPVFDLKQPGHNQLSKDAAATALTSAATQTPGSGPNNLSGHTGMPRAIAEAAQAVWYVRPPSGGQYGPADGQVFYQWILDNRVSPDSLVWRDGWAQWMIAGEAFEEFFGSGWRLAPAGSPSTENLAPQSAAAIVPGNATVAVNHGAVNQSAGPQSALTPSAPNQATANQTAANQGALELETRAPISSLAASRRKRKQTNYAVVIVVLAVMAIGLVVVLASVVMNQQTN
ncbi:MAG: DUF4339 domain-containing protein [Pirellulaceae bacterium]|nr:DUF4339 domain-containing protein [Pirellulaceae bacterium]